ncbi:hypothetical protein [Paenarthrobacter histidinolovorans]|uniref:hypothetical protein n=1 Tax=Paenarthrobacter histidinolovorans TaxID=43664 RepID=UPI0016653E3B|nr:hypothetical protein [Paenarthrobacter histidinolovorans]GGJ20515.1 hypothetical protein GCM10010052_17200 [Paenarthrobacter histidinolovorans]
MRASEEHRQYNRKVSALMDDVETKRSALEALIASTPGGAKALELGVPPVVIIGSPAEAAANALAEANKALYDAMSSQPDGVRNYRVLSLDGTEEYERFRCDYAAAPVTAQKLLFEKRIERYRLEEQVPDGTWVPYWAPRESN